MQKKIISASILAADFANLGKEVKQAIDAGMDYIHFDVMDHHFVPNLSVGAVVCNALRKAGITAPIDVHLMVEHPEKYIQPFADAGATLLTFHPETVSSVENMVDEIREAGMKTGLAFNPEKPVNVEANLIEKIDLILLMSVHPGFSGQSFLPGSLDKIKKTRDWMEKTTGQAMLGIDGGIKTNNIGDAAKAGADFFVVGSGLFHTNDYRAEVARMRWQVIGQAPRGIGNNGQS